MEVHEEACPAARALVDADASAAAALEAQVQLATEAPVGVVLVDALPPIIGTMTGAELLRRMYAERSAAEEQFKAEAPERRAVEEQFKEKRAEDKAA